MIYRARALGADTELSVEREGLRVGSRFIDYADVDAMVPMNHRVPIDLTDGERVEVSMLGFSYDGFWEELSTAFANRTLEALFVEGAPLMHVEGEYQTPAGKGRAIIELYPDAVCILPPNRGAVRIPLCFTGDIRLNGYMLGITLNSGAQYTVGRMGYDTAPFAERASQAADRVKKERLARISELKTTPPFTHTGLFRTTAPELYWQAAYAPGRCAVELFTGEDAATYLYRFPCAEAQFRCVLEEALEAMGPHREIIWWSPEQIAQKPLYRMSADRSRAVRTLRAYSAGRLIHNASHAERLAAFLN